MKPTIEIRNARVLNNRLFGTINNHHTLQVDSTGKEVVTSTIVKQNGNTIETLNTIYVVLNWVANEGNN